MTGNVDDLMVFRRAYALSLEVHRASLEWPRAEQHGGIASHWLCPGGTCGALAQRIRADRPDAARPPGTPARQVFS